MQKREKVRHNSLDRVRHEHLVAVELNLVAGNLHLILNLRKIENTREVEREINVQVNVEQRVVGHRIEGVLHIGR